MTLIIIVSFCTTHNLVILLTCTKEETLGAHMNRANLVVRLRGFFIRPRTSPSIMPIAVVLGGG